MLIHGQIMRLASIKNGHPEKPESPQHFYFDLTCDVIGNLEMIFRIEICQFMCSLNISRLHFENPSVTFRDLGGRGESPLRVVVVGSEHTPTGRGGHACRGMPGLFHP